MPGRQPAPRSRTGRFPGGCHCSRLSPASAASPGAPFRGSLRASPRSFCACRGREPSRSPPALASGGRAAPCGGSAVAASSRGRERARASRAERSAADKAKRRAGNPPPINPPRLRSRRCPHRRQPASRGRGRARRCPGPFLPRGSPTCSEESIHLRVGDSAFLRRPFGGIHGWGRGGGEPGGW